MMNTLPIFLDFEASSLNANSYPIEVAWSDLSGNITSYLIKPEESWQDWDSYAEQAIHRISRVQLHREGQSATFVVEQMRNALSGKIICTTDVTFDAMWCRKLFSSETHSETLPFEFISFRDVLEQYFGVDNVPSDTQLLAIQKQVSEQIGVKHRASADVQFLRDFYTALTQMPDYQSVN